MTVLIPYLRAQWWLLVATLVLGVTTQICGLIEPLIFSRLIDRYVTRLAEHSGTDLLRGVIALLAMAAVAAWGAQITRGLLDYTLTMLTMRVGVGVYTSGVRHVLDLPYSVFEEHRSGELLGKLQRLRQDVERLISQTVNVVFVQLVSMTFVVVYAFGLHWSIGIAFILPVPLLVPLDVRLSRRLKTIQKTIVTQTSALAASTTESLRNMELVRSIGLGQHEVARLTAATHEILQLELKKLRYTRTINLLHWGAVYALRIGDIALLIYLAYSRQISTGQFFSLLMYTSIVLGPLQGLTFIAASYRDAEVAMETLRQLSGVIGADAAAPVRTSPRLLPLTAVERVQFDHVSFTYPSAVAPALADVTLDIRRGETIAFVGPSGAGKTTLVKLLLGLYTPQAGGIAFNGRPAATIDLQRLRQRVGLVTQETHLFAGTVGENLRFVAPEATDAECLDVLRQAACRSLRADAGGELSSVVGEGGKKLSGGEKQRLAIARALLRRPDLLIFDEATSSLDSLTEHEIGETIRAITARRRVITILIAHRLSTIMHADRIVVLEQGRVIEMGLHTALIEQGGLYAAMWRKQTGMVGDRSSFAAMSPQTA